MSERVRIAFGSDGLVKIVYNDAIARDLQELSRSGHEVSVDRASHVEPAVAFCGWRADMAPSGGPVLRAHTKREDALSAERDWLNDHLPELANGGCRVGN